MTTATPPVITETRFRAATAPGTFASLTASTRAELMRLRRWPPAWVIVSVWLAANLTFAYIFNYVSYVTGSGNFGTDGAVTQTLGALLPEALPTQLTGGMPIFGAALMLIFGALAAGSGYNWGTWKTAMMQGPGRLTAFGGTLIAVAIAVVGVVTATLTIDVITSLVIATVEDQSIIWPPVTDLVQSWAGGLLILGMWAAAGVFVGTLTRSPALAVGLGLVWTMAIENLLRGVANLLSGMEYVTDYLPGTAAGSVAGALGASTDPDGGAGVLTILGGGVAAAVAALYLVAFTGIAAYLMRRRDVT